ncbi:MAG TPA: DUF1273 domain-containing protein [Eubacterium sp.]|nr:DUF1273 domain-containing protein [Eubacterium sp.]
MEEKIMGKIQKATTIDIKKACTFTGHRPERLALPEEQVIAFIKEQVKKAIEDGYTCFISGMQRGVDIWAAEAVFEERKNGHDLKLVAACSFEGMERSWDLEWIKRYNRILREADGVYFIGDYPSRAAHFMRDEWLVDHASRLIAVYTGAPGGTKHTMEYGVKKGLEVIRI